MAIVKITVDSVVFGDAYGARRPDFFEESQRQLLKDIVSPLESNWQEVLPNSKHRFSITAASINTNFNEVDIEISFSREEIAVLAKDMIQFKHLTSVGIQEAFLDSTLAEFDITVCVRLNGGENGYEEYEVAIPVPEDERG